MELSKGNFREDLYYRLNLVHIKLPPLRERKEDIPLLAKYFLKHSKVSGKGDKEISKDAFQVLMDYDWPGNIREVENIIERFCIFIEAKQITAENMKPYFQISTSPLEGEWQGTTEIAQLEKAHILRVLSRCEGNKTKAAHLLGISVKTLYNKIKSYDISL
jgi:transcriptional regulator with PAS, ATPase and Fis domain